MKKKPEDLYNRKLKRKRRLAGLTGTLCTAALLFCLYAGYTWVQTGSLAYLGSQLSSLPRTVLELPGAAVELVRDAGEKLRSLRAGTGTGNIEDLRKLPEYQGEPYVTVNGGVPLFSAEDLLTDCYERYSEPDSLGRCGPAEGHLSRDMMPREERGEISEVRPTGYHGVVYDNIEDGFLYNRCHLIGFQLTGQNANERNLITGTRYMNVEGMLPWENAAASYIRRTGDEVLYRVTPVFAGDELLARGVEMEAQSLQRGGLEFHVYVFNVQPGIEIDYATGESRRIS